jgi:signal transduction histidine kinase
VETVGLARVVAAAVTVVLRPMSTSVVIDGLRWPSWSATCRELMPASSRRVATVLRKVGGDPIEPDPVEESAQVAGGVRAVAAVVAAQSLETVDTATSSTIGLLAVGDPLLVLPVGGLGFVLVGRALRPVESLRAQAAGITAADLSARLPVVPTGDEIARPSLTLNEMLGRLETSAAAELRFVADASHELRSPLATIRTCTRSPAALATTSTGPQCRTKCCRRPSAWNDSWGDLLLLARSGATRSVVEVSPSTMATRAVIRIHDDGDGIAPDEHLRIFDRFVRLDEARARDDGATGRRSPSRYRWRRRRADGSPGQVRGR